jgi:hypothetical protein
MAQVVKGVIKELGSAVTDADAESGYASVTYTYIEFEDGQMLRRVRVLAGLNGKLDNALQEKQPVELHVYTLKKKELFMLALKTHEGKIYATDMSGSLLWKYVVAVFFTIVGFPLILLWGIGVFLLFIGVVQLRALRRLSKGRAYLRSLPNAIAV